MSVPIKATLLIDLGVFLVEDIVLRAMQELTVAKLN